MKAPQYGLSKVKARRRCNNAALPYALPRTGIAGGHWPVYKPARYGSSRVAAQRTMAVKAVALKAAMAGARQPTPKVVGYGKLPWQHAHRLIADGHGIQQLPQLNECGGVNVYERKLRDIPLGFAGYHEPNLRVTLKLWGPHGKKPAHGPISTKAHDASLACAPIEARLANGQMLTRVDSVVKPTKTPHGSRRIWPVSHAKVRAASTEASLRDFAVFGVRAFAWRVAKS